MVSEINRLLELNVDYCERSGRRGDASPGQSDAKRLKEAYSVQTPHTAVVAFFILLMDAVFRRQAYVCCLTSRGKGCHNSNNIELENGRISAV